MQFCIYFFYPEFFVRFLHRVFRHRKRFNDGSDFRSEHRKIQESTRVRVDPGLASRSDGEQKVPQKHRVRCTLGRVGTNVHKFHSSDHNF